MTTNSLKDYSQLFLIFLIRKSQTVQLQYKLRQSSACVRGHVADIHHHHRVGGVLLAETSKRAGCIYAVMKHGGTSVETIGEGTIEIVCLSNSPVLAVSGPNPAINTSRGERKTVAINNSVYPRLRK